MLELDSDRKRDYAVLQALLTAGAAIFILEIIEGLQAYGHHSSLAATIYRGGGTGFGAAVFFVTLGYKLRKSRARQALRLNRAVVSQCFIR